MNALLELWSGLVSLVKGLGVTGKYFLAPNVNVRYPRAEVDATGSFRGHVELLGKPDKPEEPRCIACMTCVVACPSQCISIESAKAEKGKKPVSFRLKFQLCSLCGQCVQNCPVDSMAFSKDLYATSFDRNAFDYDLLARLRERAARGESTGMEYSPVSGGGKDIHLPRQSLDTDREDARMRVQRRAK